MRPTTSPWSDEHCDRPHAAYESTACPAPAPGPCAAIAIAVACALAACSNAEPSPAPVALPAPIPLASAAAPPPDAGAAAAAQGGAEVRSDPFAGVDPTQNDVLRNIARLDAGATAKAAPRPLAPRSVDAAAPAADSGDTAPLGVASPVAAPAGTAANAPTGTTALTGAGTTEPPARAIGTTMSGPANIADSAGAPMTGSNAAAAATQVPVAAPTLAAVAVPAATTAVTTRRAIAQPSPDFPREALREGINEGRVVANLAVAADGRVTDVTVISATPSRAFGRVAQQSLRDWRYEAAAEPSSVQVELVFRNN
jgi:TonB family protein